MHNIQLISKYVGNIQGHFFVPSYQRGYRWSRQEVRLLVNDILSSAGTSYCLQPIVVKKLNDLDGVDAQYELIDGQQRLTTLYLLYKYMSDVTNYPLPEFSLTYKTREKSEEFLKNIDIKLERNNIDFWYISHAYQAISEFLPFPSNRHKPFKIDELLKESVSVIWYEVPENEDSISLFQRLNIGKIQLTAAELVKALFLSENKGDDIKKYQEEIALQWDNIERDLHDETLWSFLTNSDSKKYLTRIDLVLDLISMKKTEEKDPLFTFFYFDTLAKGEKDLYGVWREIQAVFLQLKDWCADHELYHKIGYLIASEYRSLGDIYEMSKGKRKQDFKQSIEKTIKDSVTISDDINDLLYGSDNEMIKRILLLFNVESVRTIDEKEQWFPFSKYKESGRKWSLEHIHAQHSEGLDTNRKRATWIEGHLSPLRLMKNSLNSSGEDVDKIEEFDLLLSKLENLHDDLINNPKGERYGDEFKELQYKVIKIFSKDDDGNDYMHQIENLALLDVGSNAALSNYVFAAKRNLIIDMDKRGAYIPFCTKMVFFKYYTEDEDIQALFWGAKDRAAYLKTIKEKLSNYLTSNGD